MFIKLMQYSSFWTMLILLTSCNFLKSEYYPGKPLKVGEEEVGKEIVWKMDQDKVYHTIIVNESTVKAGNLEWNQEKGAFYAVNQNIILSKLDDRYFINIKDHDGMYKILKFTVPSATSVVAYSVNKKKMEEFIKDEKLNAKIVENDIVLDLTKSELNDFVNQYCDEIFDYDSPLVFQKIYEKKPKKQKQESQAK